MLSGSFKKTNRHLSKKVKADTKKVRAGLKNNPVF